MSNQSPPVRPKRFPRSFRMAIKPIGSACNLDCAYRYYHHKKDLLPHAAGTRIADDLLEEFIRQYLGEQDVPEVVFTWHGGEPTLAGLDFYRKAVALQQKYAAGKRVLNDLQTNGILLDDAWCEFLKEHDFLVGLSIDGPRRLHDCYRVTDRGEPTFDRVYATARRLQEHGVAFNAITVIHAQNVHHPVEVYRFLTEELGCWRVQWLPCAELKVFRTTAPHHGDTSRMPVVGSQAARPGHPTSIVHDWSVDPDDWGEFLCRTFDLWRTEGLGKVVVNWFESLVAQWLGYRAQICSLGDVCGRSLIAMESDGSLFSCDRFVYPEYRLGNLRDGRPLGEIVYSNRQRQFGCNKRNTLPDYCRRCTYSFACNGECPKSRFLKTPDGEPGLNYFCTGIKRFLTYADPYLREIAAQVQARRAREVPGSGIETASRE